MGASAHVSSRAWTQVSSTIFDGVRRIFGGNGVLPLDDALGRRHNCHDGPWRDYAPVLLSIQYDRDWTGTAGTQPPLGLGLGRSCLCDHVAEKGVRVRKRQSIGSSFGRRRWRQGEEGEFASAWHGDLGLVCRRCSLRASKRHVYRRGLCSICSNRAMVAFCHSCDVPTTPIADEEGTDHQPSSVIGLVCIERRGP